MQVVDVTHEDVPLSSSCSEFLLMARNALLLVNDRRLTPFTPLTIPNLRLPEPIQLPRAHRVQINRERERDKEAHQRHAHGDMVALVIGHQPRESGEERPARHGGHDPRGPPLRVRA